MNDSQQQLQQKAIEYLESVYDWVDKDEDTARYFHLSVNLNHCIYHLKENQMYLDKEGLINFIHSYLLYENYIEDNFEQFFIDLKKDLDKALS